MCYLKKFVRISMIPVPKRHFVDETDAYSSDQSVFHTQNEDMILNIGKIQTFEKRDNQKEMLMKLFSLLNYNTVMMDSLQMKINKSNEALENLHSEMVQNCDKYQQTKCIESEDSLVNQNSQNSRHFSDQVLTQKLFGIKSYKYKLKLNQQLAQIIYKQRNISFSVALINAEGKTVRNCNVVQLCLGVCDSNGEWISENKSGQNFMKGKTQAELYHGESNYSKIYPRDVSRSYEGGKVNFVIYPKPSILHYSGNTSFLESKVNFDQIEPIIIKDLTIRAKKKE